MNAYLAAFGIPLDAVRARGLPECREAADLELAEVGADGTEQLLIPAAARAWRELRAAANGDGVAVFIVSAFRSVDRQAEVIRRKLDAGVALRDILAVCAPPGFSEHHTGRAVDVSTFGSRALELEFEQTAAHAWLSRRAGEFGFVLSYPAGNPWGYQYEPWHWCYRELAQRGAARARSAGGVRC